MARSGPLLTEAQWKKIAETTLATSLATLPAALDRGTHQCLAEKLPTLGRALRPFAHDLWCFFSYRLLHDRLTEGCAIASR
jgi:hypothetical protein